jgi:hypothetical protein
MALGLQTEAGGGDFSDIVKFDARAGRFFRVDRREVNGQWETDPVEITDGFQAIFDMRNIQVGWMLFAAGVAPIMTMVPLGDPMPDRPTDQHKQGFKLMLKLGKSCGGDVREFASQAKAVIGALDTLHDLYTAGLKDNAGKLPVVALKGTTAIKSTGKGQTSTNYAPIFEIVKWVDPPAELIGGTPANEPKQEPVQQLKSATQEKPAPAADDDDF